MLVAGTGFAVQAADRGEPVRIDVRTASLVVREGVARALAWSAGWLARLLPEPMPTVGLGDRRVPVVLVPGLTVGRAGLWGLATFLRRRGFATVHPFERPDGGLAIDADALARVVAATQVATGAAQVDLVGFGTGGLVAAWYLRHHGPDRVRRLVTIGTPWRGTKLAVFSRAPEAPEVKYGAHALDGLCPPPVPTVCVYSPDDPVVVPASSAVPEHGVDAVRVEAGGHVDLLLSARVYRAVQAALDRPLG